MVLVTVAFLFLFSFCFCDDEGHGLLLGFFFFLFAGGRLKTMILVLVFWVYCLYWSLFYGFLSSVSPSFSFVPSLSVSLFCLLSPPLFCHCFSFYKTKIGGNSQPHKRPATDPLGTINDET